MDINVEIAARNNWISDRLLTVLTTIDVILTSEGITDMDKDLDALLNVDETYIDPVSISTDITAIYKKYLIEYFTKQGILVDPEIIATTSIFELSDITLALHQLKNVPEDLAPLIDNLLNSNIGVSNTELLYNLISIIEPNIKFNLFFNLIEKVSDAFIEKLKSGVTEILVNTNLENNISPEDTTTEDVPESALRFTILKNLMDILKKDTPESLVNILTNDAFLIFYFKFGDNEIQTKMNELIMKEGEIENNDIKNLIYYTAPISIINEMDRNTYEDKIINFLKIRLENNLDQEYVSNSLETIFDILTNKTKFDTFVKNKIEQIKRIKE